MIDELERLKEFRATEPPPTAEAELAAREALARAMRAAARRRRTRRWRPRVVAMVAATSAATVALLSLVGSGGTPAGPGSAAAAALNQLAEVVATQSLTPGPGQYLYVDSVSVYPSSYDGRCTSYAPDHRQIWISANGSGLLRETRGKTTFPSAACRRLAGPITQGTSDTWFAAGCLVLGPTNNWRSLSTKPAVLLRQMRRIDGGPLTPAEDFVHVGDFLRETDAPPAVRAAIYRAAALIPGIRLLGWVRDHRGRAGLGIALTAHGLTSELIFDHQTGELLAEQSIGRTGGFHYWASYLRQRVVNELPSRSPLPLTPACKLGAGRVTQTPAGGVVTGMPGNVPGLKPNPH